MAENITKKGEFVGLTVRAEGTNTKGQPYKVYAFTVRFTSGKEFGLGIPSWVPAVLAEARKVPVGSMVECETDAKNNVTSIKVLAGPDKSGAAPPATKTAAPPAVPVATPVSSDESFRETSVLAAVNYYRSVMDNGDKFARLIKKTETQESMEHNILDLASKLFDFVKGKYVSGVASSADSLGSVPPLDQPDLPADNGQEAF